MAERGAYLTGTTNYGKPTLFEIVAQESLASTIEPAFKKIFSFFATCNVDKYGWTLEWSDEFYALFNGFLQKFYLKNYDASFSETFYGLKRISISNTNTANKLSDKQKLCSLILLILNPYIKSKIDKFELDKIDGKYLNDNWKNNIKIYFIKIYKIYNLMHSFLGIYYYLLYISKRSSYPTPLLRFMSMTLTYSAGTEFTSISELLSKWKNGTFTTHDGAHLIQRGFTRSLELGAFFLQFINWWNQENFNVNLLSLPVPPAPTVPDKAKKYKGLCPICMKKPKIPTAIAISGYVYCYQCILIKIKIEGKCPVTNYPAKEDDLIRLYVD